jgi:hypothetical protein
MAVELQHFKIITALVSPLALEIRLKEAEFARLTADGFEAIYTDVLRPIGFRDYRAERPQTGRSAPWIN